VACPITNCRRCAASKTISINEWQEARIKDVIDIEGRWICYWAYFKVRHIQRSRKGRLNLMRSSWHHGVSHTIGPGLKEELKGLHLYSWNYQFYFSFLWKMWIPALALITSTNTISVVPQQLSMFNKAKESLNEHGVYRVSTRLGPLKRNNQDTELITRKSIPCINNLQARTEKKTWKS
jgi:hypothetical protein